PAQTLPLVIAIEEGSPVGGPDVDPRSPSRDLDRVPQRAVLSVIPHEELALPGFHDLNVSELLTVRRERAVEHVRATDIEVPHRTRSAPRRGHVDHGHLRRVTSVETAEGLVAVGLPRCQTDSLVGSFPAR